MPTHWALFQGVYGSWTRSLSCPITQAQVKPASSLTLRSVWVDFCAETVSLLRPLVCEAQPLARHIRFPSNTNSKPQRWYFLLFTYRVLSLTASSGRGQVGIISILWKRKPSHYVTSWLPGRDHNSSLLVFELSLTQGKNCEFSMLLGQNHRQDFCWASASLTGHVPAFIGEDSVNSWIEAG